ncbi:uncharacterized protein LOC123552514 [Mercenaria mercenaria]|uniref:uncharacterized protein LOC123552514 n=1 Tax=Mercenaria mercenaria TaxID=6596 RepID=UPI00234EF1E8|nr:uncharacterized protein LOC123552514 [Mercenaria mercenaria]XP_045198163.2 uncharacterized protein LOC123552514 [Mercenaria mercenaria]
MTDISNKTDTSRSGTEAENDVAIDKDVKKTSETEDAEESKESDEGSADLSDKKTPEKKFQSEGPKVDSMKLLEATKAKNFDLVSAILQESPKLLIDTTDEVGKTTLHYLCNLGNTSEITLCLQRKPDVNKADKIGWTPLHYASMKGNTDVVQLLVDYGADANKPDLQKGRTPLHLAVSRNHQDIVETLVHCGADPNAADQDGKTAADICRNEYMRDKLKTAALNKKNELGELTVETMDIRMDKPTPFPNLGLTVTPVQTSAQGANTKVEKDETNTCFTMSIRKTSADKLDDKFTLEDTEEVCSDIFTLKTARTNGPTNVDISIPILTAPNAAEEIVMKTDKGGEIVLTDIKEEDTKWQCIASVDVTSLDSFVVVSRPKLEKFSVGSGAANIKSTVDDRVELDIPKGTFDKPVTITMEITDPPQKEELAKVMNQCADISSTTSFYSLDSGGTTLSKPVSVKVPLPTTFTGQGKLLLFTMNDAPTKESPESWKLMSEGSNIKTGRIEFDVPSFSIKVAVETSSTMADDMSQFGSTSSFSSLVSQVSRIYRKSRRKEHSVTFLCMSRRVGTSNTFKIVVMCCKLDQRAKNVAYWEGEGFENHGEVKHLNNESEIRARAKQRFKITSQTLGMVDEQEHIIDFQPKLEKSHRTLTVKIPTGQNITTGQLEFYKVEKKTDDDAEINDTEKIALTEVTLLAFNPKMMEQLDGRSFLTYKRMVVLQKEIIDVWWKILILMDIPFKTIEKTLGDSGSLEEKVNGLLFDWKEQNRGDKSRGLPILMSALCRCGKRLIVNDLQRQLLQWKNDAANRNDAFYKWLMTAYKYDLLIPTRYDSPMSDTFLAMLADRIKPSTDLAAALSIPGGTISDVLANNRVYPTEGIKTMKIFDHFRMGMNNKANALKKLVDGLKDINLKEDADYVIMMTGAWLKRQPEGDSVFAEVYKSVTK